MTKIKSQIDIINPIIENINDGYDKEAWEYSPEKITKMEAIIYDWIVDNYGFPLAKDSRCKAKRLIEIIHDHLVRDYKQSYQVVYCCEE